MQRMYRAWMTCGYRPTPQQKPDNKVRWPGTKRFPTASFYQMLGLVSLTEQTAAFRGRNRELFQTLDAGNPPVQCGEREQETEPCQTGLRRRGESLANRHWETTVTAPFLDSTDEALLSSPAGFGQVG